METFEKLTHPLSDCNFDEAYEKMAKTFIDKYDSDPTENTYNKELEYQILNDNFTCDEIVAAIDSLKNNKSPGADMIPPEFIKASKSYNNNRWSGYFFQISYI